MNTMNIPSTLEILNGTKLHNEGESLKIADLGGLHALVAIGSARMVRYYLAIPETGLTKGRLILVYTVKRNRIMSRHTEFALEYAYQHLARLGVFFL